MSDFEAPDDLLNRVNMYSTRLAKSNRKAKEKKEMKEKKQKREYFVIKPSEDGAQIYNMSKGELHNHIKDLDKDEWSFIDDLEEIGSDPNYWGHKLLIIKGQAIKPQPKEIVTKFTIP